MVALGAPPLALSLALLLWCACLASAIAQLFSVFLVAVDKALHRPMVANTALLDTEDFNGLRPARRADVCRHLCKRCSWPDVSVRVISTSPVALVGQLVPATAIIAE